MASSESCLFSQQTHSILSCISLCFATVVSSRAVHAAPIHFALCPRNSQSKAPHFKHFNSLLIHLTLSYYTASHPRCVVKVESTHMQTTIQPTSLGRISTIQCTSASLLVHLQTFLQRGKHCRIRSAWTSL